ncbi:hypothetical protein BGZ95_004018 [Linnemannia exigua]|uniref:F-box domain-containing protein n=1 Tax=Linnemannia exigua TaxID=604196 RepID=A0AAD4H1Y4_9FUNG|nr:hypothetical protein BGZ95_004018 [Linnemannia exigua]
MEPTSKRARHGKATTATTKTTASLKEPPLTADMTTFAARTLFSIPELAEIIGRFLNVRDQLHLSMTNRLLHQTLSPLFWSSLDLFNKPQAERLLQSPDAHLVLGRNFYRIQELKVQTSTLVYLINSMIRHPEDLPMTATTTTLATTTSFSESTPTPLPESPLPNPLTVTLPRLTRLTSLEFKTEQIPDGDNSVKDAYPEISVMPRLTWLLHLNSSLTQIRVSGCRVRSPFDAHLFIQALPSLTSLRDLELNFRMSAVRWEVVIELLFFCLPVSVENVSLCPSKLEDGIPPSLGLPPLPGGGQDTELAGLLGARRALGRRYGPLERLRRLQIEFVLETFSPPLWNHDGFRSISADLAQAVVQHCPRLRGLNSCGQASNDIIDALPQQSLETIANRSRHCEPKEMALCLQAISRSQYASLREVRIEECRHVRGSAVQAILWTCAALETLVIKGRPCVATRLKHLVEKDWVCTRLKTLEITVDLRQVRVPAVSLATMPAVYDATWTMLRRFYRQIGALTEIEVLNLGIRSKEMQYLDENGQERVAIVDKPKSKKRQARSQGEEDDSWSADDDTSEYETARTKGSVVASNADATFPGLLSLGDECTRRAGYLNCLAGLTKLRELRGHVQVTTSETLRTVGLRELEWMLEHWPKLEVAELVPVVKTIQSKPRRPLPGDKLPPHIVWLQQQRPDIHIKKDSS